VTARSPRPTRRRLTRHFVVEEFDSHDGVHVRQRDHAALEHLCDWWLEPLRSEFGPVTITSGFRSFAQNRKVGGAARSVHLLRTQLPNAASSSLTVAAAADIRCLRGAPHDWARWARLEREPSAHLGQRGRGGVGLYPSFVHLDTGTARDW
jgi:uncharacterized protein YcbK (DUF882 family)